MNLFNYLMAKKGHNTSVRDDLLAYLLGKRTPKEVKTATGTTISISDVTSEKIVSLTLSKESTQDGTPAPENPVEVKTIKSNVGITITDGTNTRNYTIPLGNNEIAGIGDYKDELIVDKNGKCWLNKKIGKYIWDNSITSSSGGTFGTMKTNGYICRYTNYYKDIIMSSNRALIMCNRLKATNNALWNGSNGEGIQISSGSKSIYMAMSYNTLETYYGSELTSNNIGNAWNDYFTNNYTEIYTPLETSQLIDLNYTVDLTLFKGINNISNSDDMDMTLKYY